MPGETNVCERSLRPYSTTEKYLLAVREDLAEWLSNLYPDWGIDSESFFTKLETGVLLCKHINRLIDRLKETSSSLRYPSLLLVAATRCHIHCRTNVQPGTFQARDNICSCLRWCRAMKMKECLLFETDDLVLRKNDKSVVLCLMEVARIGAKLGLPMPTLIQFEKEIDADELRHATGYSSEDIDDVASSLSNQSSSGGSNLAISSESLTSSILPSSLKNVDQVVTEQVRECRCQTTFPLIKVAPGKYRVGPSHLVIYVRILRNHVMVRVGGGWDTLEHFLEKHDPCRRRGCCNEPLRSASSSTGTSTTGTVKSQPPSELPKVRRQKTDLTPLQVVFNRDCHTTGVSGPTQVIPLSKLREFPAAAADVVKNRAACDASAKRRVSQPQSKVELRRPSQGVLPQTRSPRARSMDVGLLVDQENQRMAPKSSMAAVGWKNKISSKSRILLKKIEKENAKASIPADCEAPSLLEIASDRPENGVSATPSDHWDNAYNRHRQNFLRIKKIFAENQNEEIDGNPFANWKGKGGKSKSQMARDLGSSTGCASSPDSATDEEVSEMKKRESAEEGFFSDASCKSE